LECLFGYVDDCWAAVRAPSIAHVYRFIAAHQSVHAQFEWTHEISLIESHLLDLTIYKGADFQSSGLLQTCTYKKPGFKASFVPAWSWHPPACKRAIFEGESVRHLYNCSTARTYSAAIEGLVSDMNRRGYLVSTADAPPYDPSRRESFLQRIAVRDAQRSDVPVEKQDSCVHWVSGSGRIIAHHYGPRPEEAS